MSCQRHVGWIHSLSTGCKENETLSKRTSIVIPPQRIVTCSNAYHSTLILSPLILNAPKIFWYQCTDLSSAFLIVLVNVHMYLPQYYLCKIQPSTLLLTGVNYWNTPQLLMSLRKCTYMCMYLTKEATTCTTGSFTTTCQGMRAFSAFSLPFLDLTMTIFAPI